MSQSLHQGIYNFPNAYERPAEQSPVFDAGGMLTEIMNLDNQISAAEELSFINPQVKATSSASTNLDGFHLITPVPSSSNMQQQQSQMGMVLEGQGLSLSLSSLRNLEANNKFEKMNIGNGGLYFPNSCGSEDAGMDQLLFTSPRLVSDHLGYVESVRATNSLRNSRYLKATQELLLEFCCVGRGQFKNHKINTQERNPNSGTGAGASSSKEQHPLSPSERNEYQRRKVRLLSMLDEVEARYMRYCEQIQAMVNSFDLIVGRGAAAPYTGLARRAMSQHFRVMKEAIMRELKAACEALGEKDGSGGITKGATPRLKMLEQKFRQQKALQHMGIMDSETWRPQRGLPERSVNILRAWLFEHFLHPYSLSLK